MLIVVVAGIWRLWFGTPPQVPERPVHLVRGEDGRFVPTGEEEAAEGIRFEFQAGSLQANNTFSSAVSATRSGTPWFACRSISVHNLSDHLLMELVGARLIEALQDLSCLERLDYYPSGHKPDPGGQLAPDIFVTLDLARISESGFQPSRKLDATVLVTAGPRFARCRSGYHDDLSAPVVDFHLQGTLHHLSTTTGVSSSAAEYKQASIDIAGQIAQGLIKQFNEYREQDGLLPELPACFYPPYRAPEGIPLESKYDLELVMSHRGFLSHGDSFWRLSTEQEATDLLPAMEALMKTSGWRTGSLETDADRGGLHLRMYKDSDIFVVFLEDENRFHRLATGAVAGEDEGGEEAGRREWIVNHRDRMSRHEVEGCIDRLLEAGAPLDTLMVFEQNLTRAQWRRIVERVEESPPKTPRAWYFLARRHRNLEEDEDARTALQRAWALQRTLPDGDELRDDLEELAEELGVENPDEEWVTRELLEELGFTELRAGMPVLEMEIGVDEPVHFFGDDERGGIVTVSLRVLREGGKETSTSYALQRVQASSSSRSWGKGGLTSYSVTLESGAVLFTVTRIEETEEAEETERFRLKVDPLQRAEEEAGSS